MKKTDHAAMTVTELKTLAKKNNVTLKAGATKAHIITALGAAKPVRTVKTSPVKKASAKAASVKTAVKTTAAKKSAATVKSAAKTAAAAAPAKKSARKTVSASKASPALKPSAPKRGPVRKAAKKGAVKKAFKLIPGIEEPSIAQERVSDAKFYTGSLEQKQPLPHDYLPSEYGEERIALLVRDPHTGYAYWEVTQARLEREKSWFGWDSKLCVRIYDVTGVQFDGKNATAYFDQEVYERVGMWYFDLARPSHSFCVDLGLRSPDGGFLMIARSNIVTMPRDSVSDVMDEEWMIVDEEFMKLYGIPGGLPGGISSPQALELLRQRRLLEITSPGTFSRQKMKKK